MRTALDSKLFTEQEFAQFEQLMDQFPDSIEPFRIIAGRLVENGFDLWNLGMEEPKKGRFPLKKGQIPSSDEPAGFKSRAKYVAALKAAGSDAAKKTQVDARLKKSKISTWQDRIQTT